ncbi:unnamed protein product [Ilex paraguariensis]|uniref:F-box associated domain-containing protein n=1 Tax=Ilex paraguariensis TaxID=185542 RepID=A0ABC8R3E0_9AQUA
MPSIQEDIDHSHIPMVMEIVIGSIDGLIFLHDGPDDRMVLWNVATREFRLLPVPYSIFPPYFSSFWHVFGFGLDILNNDYKFILIRSFWDEQMDNHYPFYVVALYTLGNDSWRYLDQGRIYWWAEAQVSGESLPRISREATAPWQALTDHGASDFSATATATDLLFVGFLNHTQSSEEVVSKRIRLSLEFNLQVRGSDETSYMLSKETCQSHKHKQHSPLIDFSIAGRTTGVHLQSLIWVMEEEGCWTKLFTFQPFPKVKRPLGFWKNQDLLCESNTSLLVLYKHDTNEPTNLGIHGGDTVGGLSVFSYKESLVSVKGPNED